MPFQASFNFPLPRTFVLMHQSIPAAPSPPPPLGYCGAFARLVSPGDGAFANFVLPGAQAFAKPGHARGFLSEYNYTEDFTSLS